MKKFCLVLYVPSSDIATTCDNVSEHLRKKIIFLNQEKISFEIIANENVLVLVEIASMSSIYLSTQWIH